MRKRKNPFKLSAEDQRLEGEIEQGKWQSVSKNEAERFRSEMVEAVSRGNKDARVNLRLHPEDVVKIRKKAEREGIPYQTLMASVLHKYATDQFLDEATALTITRRLLRKKAVGK